MIITNRSQYIDAKDELSNLSPEDEYWHTIKDAIQIYKKAFVGKTITHDKICIYPSKNNIVYIGIDFHNEDVEGHSPDKTTYRVSDDGERLYMVLKGEVGSHPTWPNLLNYLKELVLSVELKMDAAVVPEEMDLTHKQCLCIIKSAQLVNYARKRGHFISFGTNKFDAYVE